MLSFALSLLLTFEGGGTVTAAAGCECLDSPDAKVQVERRAVPGGWACRAKVLAMSRTISGFSHLGRVSLDERTVDRVVMPMACHEGPGVAFKGRFFAPSPGKPRRHEVDYPSAFADFMHLRRRDGSTRTIFGAQPRGGRAPWQTGDYLAPVKLACGADAQGGYFERMFVCHVVPGEAWTSPEVYDLEGLSLDEALERYVRANGLTRTLEEKVSSRILAKMKKAPFVLFHWGHSRDMRQAIRSFPSPTLFHVWCYLKGGFDKEYPDHLPPNAQFGNADDLAAFISELHGLGHLFSPYTNPTWWCDHPRGPTFTRVGESALLRQADGSTRYERYAGNVTNDGYTVTFWHPAVRRANDETVRAFKEDFPVDLLFQDQVGARCPVLDFNSASPAPTAYIDGLLSQVSSDASKLPLGVEGGWDHVANRATVLFGLSGSYLPENRQGNWRRALKEKFDPAMFELEPLAQRLMHDKCLFYHHDLGQFQTNDCQVAWTLALGCGLNWSVRAVDWNANVRVREWYGRLARIQRDVVSRYAGRKLLSFRHDRSQMLRRGLPAADERDDGTVEACYEGGLRLKVNLGDVERQVGGDRLGPYGFVAAAEKWRRTDNDYD